MNIQIAHAVLCAFTLFLILTIGNALGMIGVSSGIAATIGLLKPDLEVLTQMLTCMGVGKKSLKTSLNVCLLRQ